jgi:hypothetical protein
VIAKIFSVRGCCSNSACPIKIRSLGWLPWTLSLKHELPLAHFVNPFRFCLSEVESRVKGCRTGSSGLPDERSAGAKPSPLMRLERPQPMRGRLMGALPVSFPPHRKADLGSPEGQSPYGPSGAGGNIPAGSALNCGSLAGQELIRSIFKRSPVDRIPDNKPALDFFLLNHMSIPGIQRPRVTNCLNAPSTYSVPVRTCHAR